MENQKTAGEIKISGVVQGVGFRPWVYKISLKYGLKGWVYNSSEGVTIHWEGSTRAVNLAVEDLMQAPPPQAVIESFSVKEVEFKNYSGFFIQESHTSGSKKALITPDLGICSHCAREILDPGNRRYLYPLTNCTNCGPRYTIIKGIPYDRHLTTMKEFKMCPKCLQEYEDPLDRRFHAQPNACRACGPLVYVEDFQGRLIGYSHEVDLSRLIQDGNILAVKGLGGFHLICDATNTAAVSRLRNNKLRDGKPFALMAADLDNVRKCCFLSTTEEEYMVSPAKPIVILKQRDEAKRVLARDINPGLDTLGFMLPYTPLHLLLFSPEVKILVATSANLASNPLITTNEDAREKLKDLADYLVVHDRQIENPCDDSVGHVINGHWQPIRRARGFVPLPIGIDTNIGKPVLACGGNLKNTFALGRDREVFLSQYLGDMDNYLNLQLFRDTVLKMTSLLNIAPEVIVHDLHPDYQTTHYAREASAKWGGSLIGVQHHHAHMVSCMVENGLTEKVIGIVCDGTGFGTDRTIWGFEFLVGNYGSFERAGHLAQVPLPGGDITIKRPERMAYSFLVTTLGSHGRKHAAKWLKGMEDNEARVIERQLERKINTAMTSSCGRLFDAAAALMGVCKSQSYEGQAPMELESLARKSRPVKEHYSLQIYPGKQVMFELNTAGMWEEILFDLERAVGPEEMAYKFHLGIAAAIESGILAIAEKTGLQKVVLSGGVFQNMLLTQLLVNTLKERGLLVYCHKQVPANDGGISLGQVIIGNEVHEHVSGSTL